MICRKRIYQSGFTLIEIIITVVFVAILGAMVLTFLSKSLVDSGEPIKRLKQTSDLNAVMANIMADYNRFPKWRSSTSYTIGSYVVPTIRNGHYYKCTLAGTSSANEPDWPLGAGSTKNDGAVTWAETVDKGVLHALGTLRNNINNKNYGSYDIVANTYIQFVNGIETTAPGVSNILKVTIANKQGETLTALFISN
jgi:prepilin-type N-terminal cleavage/methylation domain-containing protein